MEKQAFHFAVVQLAVLTAEETQTAPTLATGDLRSPKLTASAALVKSPAALSLGIDLPGLPKLSRKQTPPTPPRWAA